MLVNCKLEIPKFSPSCKIKLRCNLADYKNVIWQITKIAVMHVQQTLVSRDMQFFSEYGNWNLLEVHKECAIEYQFWGFLLL